MTGAALGQAREAGLAPLPEKAASPASDENPNHRACGIMFAYTARLPSAARNWRPDPRKERQCTTRSAIRSSRGFGPTFKRASKQPIAATFSTSKTWPASCAAKARRRPKANWRASASPAQRAATSKRFAATSRRIAPTGLKRSSIASSTAVRCSASRRRRAGSATTDHRSPAKYAPFRFRRMSFSTGSRPATSCKCCASSTVVATLGPPSSPTKGRRRGSVFVAAGRPQERAATPTKPNAGKSLTELAVPLLPKPQIHCNEQKARFPLCYPSTNKGATFRRSRVFARQLRARAYASRRWEPKSCSDGLAWRIIAIQRNTASLATPGIPPHVPHFSPKWRLVT
jgi:hypothetical protein